jgi:hypothetical protein
MKRIRISILFITILLFSINSRNCLAQSSNVGYIFGSSFGQGEDFTAGFVLAWNQAKNIASYGLGTIATATVSTGEALEYQQLGSAILFLTHGNDFVIMNAEFSGAVTVDNRYSFSYLTIPTVTITNLSENFAIAASAVLVPGLYYDPDDEKAAEFYRGYSFCMWQLSLNPLFLLANDNDIF